MYELTQLSPAVYVIESPARIGLIRLNETEICLIDAGSDRDAGRRIRRILDEKGWTLKAIYNTHSNADHIGGNQYLQKQTGCTIYAPGMEADFTRHPLLEPSFLYGGFPSGALRHKFLMAKPSEALELHDENLPEGLQRISLPGHFFEMEGFRTADDIVFLADCLSSRETLDKYQISFIYDVKAYLQTLETVKGMKARLFVPAHAPVSSEIAPLAQYNIDKVHEIADQIVTFCQSPLTFEELLRLLFLHYGLEMNFEQYALAGSTVRSYLSWLLDEGRLKAAFEDGRLLWKKAEEPASGRS